MTDDQQNAFVERFVVSFEKLAAAAETLSETYRRHLEKLYPERSVRREAVVTKVLSEEDRIREAQGASDDPLGEWLSEVEDEEENRAFVGVREREWIDAHTQKPKTAKAEPDGH